MESSAGRSAAAALREAEAARAALAARVTTPAWFFTSLAAAIAAQIALTAVGIGDGPLWALVAGLVLFGLTATVQLARLRARTGVWVGGLASRVVLGTAPAASTAYALALAAAAWAAVDARWWLVALWSLVGGTAYALAGRRWLRAYRADPAAHAGGEPAVVLVLLVLAAAGGAALLLAGA